MKLIDTCRDIKRLCGNSVRYGGVQLPQEPQQLQEQPATQEQQGEQQERQGEQELLDDAEQERVRQARRVERLNRNRGPLEARASSSPPAGMTHEDAVRLVEDYYHERRGMGTFESADRLTLDTAELYLLVVGYLEGEELSESD